MTTPVSRDLTSTEKRTRPGETSAAHGVYDTPSSWQSNAHSRTGEKGDRDKGRHTGGPSVGADGNFQDNKTSARRLEHPCAEQRRSDWSDVHQGREQHQCNTDAMIAARSRGHVT